MCGHANLRQVSIKIAIMFVWMATHGCGDDASPERQANDSGNGGTTGGTGGMAANPEGGSSGDQSPSYTPPHECKPEDHKDDPCLACVTAVCCEELETAGPVLDHTRYFAYDPEFTCKQACFESTDDGGAAETSLDRLLGCVPECHSMERPFDYVQRDLLACITGGPRPISVIEFGQVTWREGEPDEDAGITPNCLAECLPSWE